MTNRPPGSEPLVTATKWGLYCTAGGFYIDPWVAVERAVLTHAHSDHARKGCGRYLAAKTGESVLRARLGPEADIEYLPYGRGLMLENVKVSFHPAGHILGSAQIRLEHRGEVWVISGDYKRDPDPTCTPFEPLPCHTFVTESTFGLPVYRWRDPALELAAMNVWWRANQEEGKGSVLFAYSLGKAQRILASLDAELGPIFTHGAVEVVNNCYRGAGLRLPATVPVSEAPKGSSWSRALILAPPSANGSPWLRKFGRVATGFASGWMAIRGRRKQRSIDRGFVLSDHADWPQLIQTIRETRAERIVVTHGYVEPLVHWLREHGLEADGIATQYQGELDAPEQAMEEDDAVEETSP